MDADFECRVFVSHSCKSNAVVRDVAERLREIRVKGLVQ